jgi:protoheme IX farnesyltransferase
MMKTAIAVEPEIASMDRLAGLGTDILVGAAGEQARMPVPPLATSPSLFADYVELTKPRIAVMALFTVAVGYILAAGASAQFLVLFHTLVGAGLVAAGGSALNQWLERRIDARMYRTMKRPVPAGRIGAAAAVAFGTGLSIVGLIYLAATLPYPAAVAAALTLVSYAFIYTPLKTVTVWNTVIGAVPGALPPVIGWCAARGWHGLPGAFGLFLVIFLWQLPHFLAIAWMYRDDYARGGLRMLPIADPSGSRTAWVMVVTCCALIPMGLLSVGLGLAGPLSVVGCALLGLLFLREAVRFDRTRSDRQARRVLRASLLYLPGALGLLLVDGFLFR